MSDTPASELLRNARQKAFEMKRAAVNVARGNWPQSDLDESDAALQAAIDRLAALSAIPEAPADDRAELQELCDKLAGILERTVNVLRGEPPPLTRWSWHDLPELAAEAKAAAKAPLVSDMVDRFVAWPLPKDFAPDCGINFDGRKDDEWNKNKPWPTGTNLFTVEQAREMFEHALASPPAAPQEPAEPVADTFTAHGVSFNRPAPAVPLSQPLTEEQIDEACVDIWGSDYGSVLSLALQRAIARAIEAAHGIGASAQATQEQP